MIKIPSFQLLEINEKYALNNLKDEDVLSKAKVNKDDPQTLKLFVESAKKSYRNLSFEPIQQKSVIKMKVEEYKKFQDKQTLWINHEKLILKYNQLLLVGKAEKKIEHLLQVYLRDIADSKSIIFNEKQLWQVWKKLLSIKNSGLTLKIHRLILKRTYIEADKINELNIHANDVNELGIITELIKQSEQVKAITIKIKGFYQENKWITIRIDKNGSILIYGKHKPNIILKFLQLLSQAIL